jgi:hypothetical protein
MFEEFLKAYIQDLIECSSDNYEITEDQKEIIASRVSRNEYVWNILDEAIYNELDKYIKEVD